MVELGQTVKDVISGYEGVVTSITAYLYGCSRVTVQSREMKDGKPVDYQVFDEQQLQIVGDVPNLLERAPRNNAPGGERQPIARAPIPTRY